MRTTCLFQLKYHHVLLLNRKESLSLCTIKPIAFNNKSLRTFARRIQVLQLPYTHTYKKGNVLVFVCARLVLSRGVYSDYIFVWRLIVFCRFKWIGYVIVNQM